MTQFPTGLTPTCEEVLLLPSGSTVRLPKATPTFKAWQQAVPFDSYGGKAVIDFDGEPLFAELAILRSFQKDGWTGVWVDTYRRRFCEGIDRSIELPEEMLWLLKSIYKLARAKTGCFGVFAWRDDEIMFAEPKRAARDRFRFSQLRWLDAALRSGLPEQLFLVVEWSLQGTTETALE